MHAVGIGGAAAIALLVVGCFSEEPDATGPDGDGEVAATVDMTAQLAFAPRTVTVRVGETVRWRNVSNLVHTVTADPQLASDPSHVRLPAGAQPFHSGDIAPGAEYRRTFAVAGTYDYVCLPHEVAGMLGTVVVTP